MIKYLSFMRLTEQGQALPPDKVADIYARMLKTTESYGGKTLEIWTTAGDYDFVTIAEFPTDEAAFKCRVKLNQFGVARIDGGPTFPVDTYLAAVNEVREPVAV